MADKEEMTFPGPCYACKTGRFTGPDDRNLSSHVRYCSVVLEKAKDIGSRKRTHDDLCPATHQLPNFTHQRFGEDDRFHRHRPCMTESRPTVAEKKQRMSSGHEEPYERDDFAFPHDDGDRWELGDDDQNDIDRTNQQIHNTPNHIKPSKLPYSKTNTALPQNYRFQTKLASICNKHKTDMNMYDDVVDLVNGYTQNGTISADSDPLLHREAFLKKIEDQFESSPMKPKHVNVQLENGGT